MFYVVDSMITEYRTKKIITTLLNKGADIAKNYGELGYNAPENGVIFFDWNGIPSSIIDYLEIAGYSIEWWDEWIIDHENGKAYRTSADCYTWEPSFKITENGELITPDHSIDAWIEHCKITDIAQAINILPSWIDLSETEYKKANDENYENGFHYGQNDDPEKIARQLFDQGVESIVFQIAENSQFYIKFNAYYS